MTNFLCIDYGDKHVGLAVAITPISEPLETVLLEKSLDSIQKYIDKYHIHALVFGLSEGAMAKKTQAYAKTVEKICHLPIYFADETLTSFETRSKVAKAGMKKTKRESKIDHLVAATILQDFLDSHSNLLE